ncbi:MAG: DNA polymerase IV [Bacteroidales bacterium]
MNRKIIHIDMDAFFASVEQRDSPEFRGKPLAVGGASARSVVAAASYEARKYGVHSAMSMVRAKALCPDLQVVYPRIDVYKSVSAKVHDIFHKYTDLVEPLSLDEAFLDVTENKMNQTSATLIANEIRVQIFEELGLTASAGVSYCKFLAKIASGVNKPNGVFVITPMHGEEYVEQLPIGKFFGVGKVTAKRMNDLGVLYGKDLKGFSKDELSTHFGKRGEFFYNIARGVDERLVNADRVRKSIGVERTFFEDVSDESELKKRLLLIVGELKMRLAKRKAEGKTLTLKIKYADFAQITRAKSFDEKLDADSDIFHIAKQLLLENRDEKKSIRLLGVSLTLAIEDINISPIVRYIQMEIPFEEYI